MNNSILFFELNGEGGITSLTQEQWLVSKQITWLHGDITGIKPILKKLDCISKIDGHALTAKETRPRSSCHQGALLATIRDIKPNKNHKNPELLSLRLWANKNRVITIQKKPSATIEVLRQSLESGNGPKDISEFLINLLTMLTESASNAIFKMDDDLDAIEDLIQKGPSESARVNLNQARRNIIVMRRYLLPQYEAINNISVEHLSWLSLEANNQIKDMASTNKHLCETLDSEFQRASIIYDNMYAQSQDVMNKKIYILTIIACIFMPLSFITGLLGINVGGIPGNNYHYAFAIVCITLVAIFVLQCLYFKIKKEW